MEQNISESARKKIEAELQQVLDWTQRELIIEKMIPGPFSATFDLDDVLPHWAGKTYANHRGTVIYSAGFAVRRTWTSREGVREQTIRRLEATIAGMEDGIECIASPTTHGYAITADTMGENHIGFNEEPAVRTVGLKADLESVDLAALRDQLGRIRRILAKFIERRPPTLAAGMMGPRTIGPISCYCYELYKRDDQGHHLLSLEDVATIVGELRPGDSEDLRAAALDRVLKRYTAVRKKLEN